MFIENIKNKKQNSPSVHRLRSSKVPTVSPRLSVKRKLGVISSGGPSADRERNTLQRKLAKNETDSSLNFNQREKTNTVVDSYNSDIILDKPTKQINIESLNDDLSDGYRYMTNKIDLIGDYLDNKINFFSELLLDQMNEMNLNSDEQSNENIRILSHPGVPSQQEMFSVGRITFNPKEDQRISLQNIYLESSRRLGSGSRIQLDLSKIQNSNKSVNLFSGQIVGVKGTNPTGKLFIVNDFIIPDMPEPSSLIYTKKDGSENIPTGSTNVFISSGPYSFTDNINYEPLSVLVNEVILRPGSKIGVCIFNGPFVDESNQYINSQCEATPEEIFRYKVAPHFNKLIDNGVKVILVSSLRDMITPYVALPQPPILFGRTAQDLNQRRQILRLKSEIKYMTNPSIFKINGATFALCNSDSIVETMSNEISFKSKIDRLSLPFMHFMQQRSFVPVYPTTSELPGAPIVEYSMASHISLDVIPDIFISVSTMKSSVRTVSGAICINPGHLVRGRTPGSYSVISFNNKNNNEEDVIKNGFSKSCSVNVYNL